MDIDYVKNNLNKNDDFKFFIPNQNKIHEKKELFEKFHSEGKIGFDETRKEYYVVLSKNFDEDDVSEMRDFLFVDNDYETQTYVFDYFYLLVDKNKRKPVLALCFDKTISFERDWEDYDNLYDEQDFYIYKDLYENEGDFKSFTFGPIGFDELSFDKDYNARLVFTEQNIALIKEKYKLYHAEHVEDDEDYFHIVLAETKFEQDLICKYFSNIDVVPIYVGNNIGLPYNSAKNVWDSVFSDFLFECANIYNPEEIENFVKKYKNMLNKNLDL